MSAEIGWPAGPYRTLQLGSTEVPYYIIPFDKHGRSDGPQTREHLVDALRWPLYRRLSLLSRLEQRLGCRHDAGYRDFMNGYMAMRHTHGLPAANPYRPLLVGVFWPSTALTFGASEEGPEIVAGAPEAMDRAVAEEREIICGIAEQLPDRNVPRFYELTQKDALVEGEAQELADIVQPLYVMSSDEVPVGDAPSPTEIVGAWRSLSPESDDLADFGTTNAPTDAPQTAGFGDILRTSIHDI